MKYSLLFAFVVFIFASCQKEIDWGTGGGSGSGELLVKVQSKTGATDSTTVVYEYDSQKRLTKEITTGVAGGQSVDVTFIINRNGTGVITTTVQKGAALLAAGIDSVVTRYHYNTGTSRYTSSAFDLSIAGFSVTDSAVYTYDGSGRIASDMHYLASGFIPAFPALKNVYTYSSNGQNLSGMDILAALNPGDPLSTIGTWAYTFDAKTSPLINKNEAVILTRPNFFNSNNSTKADFTDATDPTQSFTMDYVFKYNTSGKPDSSYMTQTPGGAVTAAKYFYQ